jgi:hypothetical protein
METFKFNNFSIRFTKEGNKYYVFGVDLGAVFDESNMVRSCEKVDKANILHKKMKLTDRERVYLTLNSEGAKQYCKSKCKNHPIKAPQLSTWLTATFAELNTPTTTEEYICDEGWVITKCADQLVDERGLPHPNPQPDIRKCVCPNLANVITHPETCQVGIVQSLAITWLSETYPFARPEESKLRSKHILNKKYLMRSIFTYLTDTDALDEPITLDSPAVKVARDYLFDNTKPGPLPESYVLKNWQLINNSDYTKSLKFTYAADCKSIINITVLRI